jgi:hypothetical protein
VEAVGVGHSAFDLDEVEMVAIEGLDVVAGVVGRHLLGVVPEALLDGEDGVDGQSLDPLGIAGELRGVAVAVFVLAQEAGRQDEARAGDPRRAGRDLALAVELGKPPILAGGQLVGAALGGLGVHSRLLAGRLLLAQVRGTAVPVPDLLVEALNDVLLGALDARDDLLADLVEVLGDHGADGVLDAGAFDRVADEPWRLEHRCG